VTGDLPTRSCRDCGQVWASARFLDPTTETDCGYCGGRLVRERRAPADSPEQGAATEMPADWRISVRRTDRRSDWDDAPPARRPSDPVKAAAELAGDGVVGR
jgi:hypothetical protein